MTPSELDEYLAVARARGALEVNVSFADGKHLSFKLAPDPGPPSLPMAPFVDKDGKPLNLDEGAPWNASDPLLSANFPAKAE